VDGVRALVERLHAALARCETDAARATAAEQCLRSGLPAIDELTAEQRAGAPDRYVQHVLHVQDEPRFSLLAIVWPPAQQTTVHDHVCWGAVAVLQGSERETRFELERAGQATAVLRPVRQQTYLPGEVCSFAPPHDIHQVLSHEGGTTISLHVYGADIERLGSSVKSTYPPGLVRD
jgi:predicted metal-dependent enzyme (double-stranded beta helix superfamily)